MLPFFLLIFPILSFFITFFSLPYIITFMKKKNKTGIDIFKKEKPRIAEMGGISIIISITLTTLFIYLLFKNYLNYTFNYIVILSTGLITGLVGIIDDIKDLGGKLKPALTLLGSIPIFIAGTYNPHPSLPFLPSTRLTLIYPILIPIGIAITSNAVNMLNVVNGATPLLVIPILISLIVVSFFLNKIELIPFILIFLFSLVAFYIYNKYPAKVFMGNGGDFFIGGILGGIAIVYRLEIIIIVAMMPYIMHGFYMLTSLKNFIERKKVKEKPVILKNNLLYPSVNKKAPMSLLRIIVSKKPLSEKQAANVLFLIAIFSSILAIITGLLTTVKLF